MPVCLSPAPFDGLINKNDDWEELNGKNSEFLCLVSICFLFYFFPAKGNHLFFSPLLRVYLSPAENFIVRKEEQQEKPKTVSTCCELSTQ